MEEYLIRANLEQIDWIVNNLDIGPEWYDLLVGYAVELNNQLKGGK